MPRDRAEQTNRTGQRRPLLPVGPAARLAGWAREHPLAVWGVVVAAVCLVCMLFIDKPLALALKAANDSETTTFFRVVTDFGKGLHWFIAAAALWVYAHVAGRLALLIEAEQRFRHIARSALFMLCALTAAGLVNTVLKWCFGRFRPRYLFDEGIYGFTPFAIDSGALSFPSGHSQTIWTVATALLLVLPRYDLAYLAVAVIVSASRVVITVHYLSDVIMGAYVGIAMTLLVHRWFLQRGGPVRITMARDRTLA